MVDEVEKDPTAVFRFPNPEKIQPPFLLLDEAKIGWNKETPLMTKVNIMVDSETRVALVGPNGAGKSTLIKTLMGEIPPLDGKSFIHGKLRVGVFSQHSTEMLDGKLTALEQMQKHYPD